MTDDEIFRLKAQADASFKLAVLSLELLRSVAARSGVTIDWEREARAFEDNGAVDAIDDRETFLVERASRKVVAEWLRKLA